MISALKWTYLGAWWQSGLSVLTILALTWMLPPEIFGINAAIWIILGIAEVLITGTLHEGLYPLKEPKENHFNAAFTALMGIAVLYFCGIQLFNGQISHFLGLPEMALPLAVSAILLPVSALCTVLEARYTRSLEMKVPVIATGIGTIAANLAALLAAWQGLGIWSLVLMPITAAAIRAAILLSKSDWRPKLTFQRQYFRDIGSFGTMLAGVRLINVAERALLRTIIITNFGPVIMGQFSIGWRLFEQLSNLLKAPLTKIAVPAFSKLHRNPVQLPELLRASDIIISSIVAPAFLGLAVTAPAFLPLILDSAWDGSILLFQLLCLIGFRRCAGSWHFPLLRGFGRPGQQFWTALAGLLFVAAAALYAANVSISAVVLVLVARSCLELPITALLIRRTTGYRLRDQILAVTPAVVSALLMGLLVQLVWSEALNNHPSWVNVFILVAVGMTSYLGASFAINHKRTRTLLAFAVAFFRGQSQQSRALLHEL